jgi:hypothetical protein
MEKKKLSTWAKENNIPYKSAWKMADGGELPVKIERNKKGSIFVMEEVKASTKSVTFGIPAFADGREESIASVRRNRAATQNPTDQYTHIENGLDVYTSGDRTNQGGRSGGTLNDSITASEAIRLTRKAYYNFADLKNIMDVMVEFSASKLYLRGGNQKSRKFFSDWFDKIKMSNLQDRFFLEHYRSCNVVPCRFESLIEDGEIENLNKTYGSTAIKNVKIPVKYVIVDPSSIIVGGNISFSNPQFFQKLNSYEVQRLKKPITQDDVDFLNSLPEQIQKDIKNGSNLSVKIPLNPENCYFIFYKKQDYEPMAVPMAWPVLRDINWKAEMKALDMAVARTTQRAILVITMGYENKNGEYMFDSKAADAMKALFESESVGKILVADFTTKVQWAIPDISKLLGKEKYEQVNEDIRTGLNNILVGSNEKFANQSIKVKLFIQRLTQSREVFLNEFLVPEMKRLGKNMGFRKIPTPYFENLDLKDEDLWNRIITQLTQMGILTSWEATKAIEDGILPDKEESIENQLEYKALKDKGLFEPVTGGPQTQKEILDTTYKQQIKMQDNQLQHDDKQKSKDRKHAAENPQPAAPQILFNSPSKLKQPVGKPAGTKNPGTKKKTRSISANLIRDNLLLATKLNTELEKQISAKYKTNKLDETQEKLKNTMLENIMMSETPDKWMSETVAEYLENPDKKNEEKFNKVVETGREFEVPDYLASIIHSSIKEEAEIEDA